MALEALSGINPCELLNNQEYPDIWISPQETTPYSNIATNGKTRSFLDILNTYTGSKTLVGSSLKTLQPNSKARLVEFMSGGGKLGATEYIQLGNILLGTSTTKDTIVDTYIIGTKGIGKTAYSTAYGNSLTDNEIWNPADIDANGNPVNPTSILGKLLRDKYLLSLPEIYFPAQLRSMPNPPEPGDSSLIYLYKVQQESKLTASQNTQLKRLEQRNLRFFGALLCEYCFYRTRYVWLLSKYFEIYKIVPSSFTAILPGAPEYTLFAGSGNAQNQYTGGNISQSDLLKCFAYHLAIINTRMIDLRRLLSAINSYYTNIFKTIQANINDESLVGSNSDLTKTINALNSSAAESKKYLSEAEFRKGALEYNAEKNRYANTLLGLYTFLNISALAIIIHLYQS